MEASSFYDWKLCLEEGDLDTGFRESEHVIDGKVRVGAQEHFYMETQTCLAIPNKEDDELEIFSSSQDPTGVQVLTY